MSSVYISSYTGTSSSFVIPTTVGKPYNGVTKIFPSTFLNNSYLQSVQGNSIKEIDQYAFFNCIFLSSISFPRCSSVGVGAFTNTNLSNWNGLSLFSQSNGLLLSGTTGIAYAPKASSVIETSACTAIEQYAFLSTQITMASFPNCASIGSYAFKDCNVLSKIYLMSSSYCTGNVGMFSNCTELTTIKVPYSMVSTYKTMDYWSDYASIITYGDLDPVFGNGSLGDQTLGNETWYAPTEDTGVIEKQYKNLTINGTITAGNRNSGIIIRCQGDCTINGAIVNTLAPRSHGANLSAYYPSWMLDSRNGTAGAGGKGGGTGQTSYAASGGDGQPGRVYGGGYSGGGAGGPADLHYEGTNFYGGANGGSATGISISTSMFVGGTSSDIGGAYPGTYGGGGCGGGVNQYGTVVAKGGQGGSGAGGSGANGGYNTYGKKHLYGGGGGGAGNIGGGVVIIYCGGTLTINGSILCYGRNGGAGSATHFQGGGGGGAGGGRIYLLYKTDKGSLGTCNVSGGSAGTGGGGSGGTGTRYYTTFDAYKAGQAPISF